MNSFINGIISTNISEIVFADWKTSIEVNGRRLSVSKAEITKSMEHELSFICRFAEPDLEWEVRISEGKGMVTVESVVANTGNEPLSLGKAFILDAEVSGLSLPGDELVALPWTVFLQRVYKIHDPEMPGRAKVLVQFNNNTRSLAMQVAFLTFRRLNTELLIEKGDAGLKRISAYCDFAGWELAPGQTTTTEVLRVAVGDNPHKQLECWADAVQHIINPEIWEDAPLGYLGWSWTDTVNGTEKYEKVTLDNLDAINQRLGGFGFRFLWTSMSNFKGSLPGNWLEWNDENIPLGRKKFIKAVQERGFLPGFWVGPFYLCSMLDELMEEFGEAILKTPSGERMVACPEWRHGDAGKIPKEDRPCLYALDPSHPKTLDFIRNVFSTYHEWGIRYYMVDFLEAGAGNLSRFPYKETYDKKLVPGPEAYTNFIRVMKESAGKDAYLLSSTGPQLHNAGILDGVRVGNDFGEGRSISKESFFYPASYVINNLDFWTGPLHALICQASNYHTHRKLYLNDSGNVLTVDKPIPLPHAQINAAIHAFSGGPSMLGDDIRHISEDRLCLIKKTVPRSKDVARPIDLFESAAPAIPHVFARTIRKDWGEYIVCAIYNFSKEPLKQNISLEKMGLKPGTQYLVWDFWDEMFFGMHADVLNAVVAPESVKILRFAEKTGQVQLLGTDMHIMMGEMEMPDFSYDPKQMVCRFRVERPAGESGMVFILVPENISVRNIDGLHIAKDAPTSSLIIGVPLRFVGGFIEHEIRFEWVMRPVDMGNENFA